MLELLFLLWLTVAIAFMARDFALFGVSGLMLILFGIEIFRVGLENSTQALNNGFAIMSWGLGFYLVYRGIIEWMNKDFKKGEDLR